jgi:hypothetical protein
MELWWDMPLLECVLRPCMRPSLELPPMLLPLVDPPLRLLPLEPLPRTPPVVASVCVVAWPAEGLMELPIPLIRPELPIEDPLGAGTPAPIVLVPGAPVLVPALAPFDPPPAPPEPCAKAGTAAINATAQTEAIKPCFVMFLLLPFHNATSEQPADAPMQRTERWDEEADAHITSACATTHSVMNPLREPFEFVSL